MHTLWSRVLLVITLALSLSSCCRNRCDLWEDTKTASRYFCKGFDILTGGDPCCEEPQVCCREDFCCVGEDWGEACYDYEPLEDEDEDLAYQMALAAFNQPAELPGEPGSSVPALENFEDPAIDPALAKVFQNVLFGYDNSLVKGQGNVAKVQVVAKYMRENPDLYLFVDGHCDVRGPEAYNLALGTRRANSVRNMLIAEGVSKDHVFTISHGKEHPLVLEQHEEAHSQNRRVEFKIYRP